MHHSSEGQRWYYQQRITQVCGFPKHQNARKEKIQFQSSIFMHSPLFHNCFCFQKYHKKLWAWCLNPACNNLLPRDAISLLLVIRVNTGCSWMTTLSITPPVLMKTCTWKKEPEGKDEQHTKPHSSKVDMPLPKSSARSPDKLVCLTIAEQSRGL